MKYSATRATAPGLAFVSFHLTMALYRLRNSHPGIPSAKDVAILDRVALFICSGGRWDVAKALVAFSEITIALAILCCSPPQRGSNSIKVAIVCDFSERADSSLCERPF
jgi:hypothetical protein